MDAIPLLRTRITGAGIRLELGAWSYGNGRTLQDAADDLVARLTAHAKALRASGMRFHPEAPLADRAYLDFLWELGELNDGQDAIRALIFGGQQPTA
jgi:hypothetical protein